MAHNSPVFPSDLPGRRLIGSRGCPVLSVGLDGDLQAPRGVVLRGGVDVHEHRQAFGRTWKRGERGATGAPSVIFLLGMPGVGVGVQGGRRVKVDLEII